MWVEGVGHSVSGSELCVRPYRIEMWGPRPECAEPLSPGVCEKTLCFYVCWAFSGSRRGRVRIESQEALSWLRVLLEGMRVFISWGVRNRVGCSKEWLNGVIKPSSRDPRAPAPPPPAITV